MLYAQITLAVHQNGYRIVSFTPPPKKRKKKKIPKSMDGGLITRVVTSIT